MFDVLAVGDFSWDVILKIGSEHPGAKLSEDKESLCFKREDKILVDSLSSTLGGNSCNVAVGLARLGFKVGYYTHIGNDDWSKKLITQMEAEKVDLSISPQIPSPAANYSTSIYFQNEKTLLIYNPGNSYRLENWPLTGLLYLSSVGPVYETFFEEVSDYVFKNNLILAFNPASHQFNKPLSSYKNILGVCQVLFVNKPEAEKMLQANQASAGDLLLKLSELGPKVVVITDKTNGSYLYSDGKYLHCPIYPQPVKQKTGAGDAFSSGFLAAYLKQASLEEALKWGTVNAAAAIGADGAQKGLLDENKMKDMVSNAQLVVENLT